eukprot:TRINITY_DN7965_c0_g1_i1.p1 TRINITY_DN7965_c0_g1~~TRINITY_DN7965_c0_g1_i1.p1  ORF type:complete len:118 (-),score=2.99 TRINITY_DN7965_c0_g1_i1:229-582(-)
MPIPTRILKDGYTFGMCHPRTDISYVCTSNAQGYLSTACPRNRSHIPRIPRHTYTYIHISPSIGVKRCTDAEEGTSSNKRHVRDDDNNPTNRTVKGNGQQHALAFIVDLKRNVAMGM